MPTVESKNRGTTDPKAAAEGILRGAKLDEKGRPVMDLLGEFDPKDGTNIKGICRNMLSLKPDGKAVVLHYSSFPLTDPEAGFPRGAICTVQVRIGQAEIEKAHEGAVKVALNNRRLKDAYQATKQGDGVRINRSAVDKLMARAKGGDPVAKGVLADMGIEIED